MENDALHALLFTKFLDINAGEFCDVRLAVDHGSQISDGRSFIGVEGERFRLGKIEGEFWAIFVVNANDVGPGDFEVLAFGERLDSRRGLRRRRGQGVLVSLVRHEGERYAEDVDVFGAEETGIFIDVIVGAAEAAAYDLLAKELRCEGAQSHDVGDGFGVPALREHADRNDGMDFFSGLPDLTDGVHGLAKPFGALLLCQLLERSFRFVL